MAARHGAAPSLWAILAGAALATALLHAQGLLGVRPPVGGGAPFSTVAATYLRPRSLTAMNVLLLLAMIGWFGFNAALGGTALAAITGVPPWAGTFALAGTVTAVALGGMRRWNGLALVTAASTVVLIVIAAQQLSARTAPLTAAIDDAGLLLWDAAAYVGYVAVFALRAPDFAFQLGRRRSLAACVASLVVPMVLVSLVGVGVHLGTGTSDVVALLRDSDALAFGNLLIAVGVVAPILASTHSGRFAAHALTTLGRLGTTALVAVPGLALAMLRFDLHLQPWLAVQAATLPPLIVPMAVEGVRRRRGAPRRRVPLWTWIPGALVGLVFVAFVPGVAALGGLAVAVVTTAAWVILPTNRRLSGPTGGPLRPTRSSAPTPTEEM